MLLAMSMLSWGRRVSSRAGSQSSSRSRPCSGSSSSRRRS